MICPHIGSHQVDGLCVLCWREQCEKAETQSKLSTLVADSTVNKLKDALDRLAKAEACCAEMWATLEHIAEYWNGDSGEAANNAAEVCQMEADAIIKKTNIGHGYLPPDKVKVLVEALTAMDCDCEDTNPGPELIQHHTECNYRIAQEALAQLKDTQ